jgi:hypothetical protein
MPLTKEQIDDGTGGIRSSADLRTRTDEQLLARLHHLDLGGVDTRPSVYGELMVRWLPRLRDASESLSESSRRLEKLTIVLIVLTIVLVVVSLPAFWKEICGLLRG